MDNPLWSQWLNFVNGCWTQDKPADPGVYPIMERSASTYGQAAHPFDTMIIYEDDEGVLCQAGGWDSNKNPISWAGWRWSVPLPHLPRPPAWEGS